MKNTRSISNSETSPMAGETPPPHAAARARVEKLSSFLDNRFRLPVVGYRFGYDSLIGLIPGVGDAAGAIMSAYLIYEARRAGAGTALLGRMGVNAAIDFVVGAIPLLGDAFDFVFKANLANARLLRAHYDTLDERHRRDAVLKGRSLR